MSGRRVAVVALAVALTAAAAASAAPPPRPAVPLARFAGMDANQLAGVNPADVQLAVGAGFVVEAVNSSVAVWHTDGSAVRQQALGAFFSDSGVDRSRDDMTDPRVLWDPVSSRFFAAVFDITRRELDVAVSTAADPTGAWTVYGLPSSGCPDQPRLGTSDAVVVVADDLFSSCRGFGRFLGGEVVVLSKPDLLGGVASPRRSSFGPDARFAAITPVQSLGSTGAEYLVAVAQDGGSIQLLHVDGPDVSSLPSATVALEQPLRDPPEAPQRGSGRTVDTGDDRIQNAVWEQGTIWLTATSACADAPRSCGRVVQLDAVAAKLVRDTTVELPSSRFLFYPAIAPDELGNVVVAFCYSSAVDFPGLGYTYVRPDGVVAAPVEVAAGSAPNDSGRFGDYSGAARDPSDPLRVWFAAQIGQASDGTSLGWGSQIAAVRVPAQPPAVATAVATAGRTGATVTATLYLEGAPTTYRVEYGPTKAYGSSTPAVAVAATPRSQDVTAAVAGLRPGGVYHLRVVVESANGASAGPDATIRMPAAAPVVAYPARAAVPAAGTTVLRAVVSPRGGSTSVVFEYGSTRAYGSRTAAKRIPGRLAAALVTARVRLLHGRVYHFRVVAASAHGRAAGADRTVRG